MSNWQTELLTGVLNDSPSPARPPHVAYNAGNNEWYTPGEYIEATRGLSEEKAWRLIEELRRRGLRFTVAGLGSGRRAEGGALKRKQGDFERLAARA